MDAITPLSEVVFEDVMIADATAPRKSSDTTISGT